MTETHGPADRRLDGNAAAGVLREVLAVDPTTAISTCAHCGNPAPLGAHLVYADAPALVLRCPGCMQVVLRCASDDGGVRLEMSGVRPLRMPPAGVPLAPGGLRPGTARGWSGDGPPRPGRRRRVLRQGRKT